MNRALPDDWHPDWTFPVEYDLRDTANSLWFIALFLNGIALGFGLAVLYAWTR